MILARMVADCAEPLFLLDADDRWAQEQVCREGWHLTFFDPGKLWSNLPAPTGVLIDTREDNGLASLVSESRQRHIPVMSLHDLGLNPLPSDIVIDGSMLPIVRRFPRRTAACYIGTSYLVLDSVYAQLHSHPKVIRERFEHVVVNLGGGDSSPYFAKILEGLRLWGRDLEVIGIPGFTQWGQKELQARAWHPLRFRWAEQDEPLHELLFRADLAITAGGSAAFEALCAGALLLALAYDRFQRVTVSMLAEADACVSLGLGYLFQPRQLPPILSAWEKDRQRRERLFLRGRQLVDGMGAERVSSILRRLIDGRRTAVSSRG